MYFQCEIEKINYHVFPGVFLNVSEVSRELFFPAEQDVQNLYSQSLIIQHTKKKNKKWRYDG